MIKPFRLVLAGLLALLTSSVALPAASAVAEEAVLKVPGVYATIQAAIDAAQPGDTVLVAPGTYSETVILNKDRVTLMSEAGADDTVIDGGGAGTSVIDFSRSTGCVVDGFTIRNGTASFGAGVNFLAVPDATLTNSTITGNVGTVGAAICINNGSPRIVGNIVTGNRVGGSGFLAATISVMNGSSPVFANNLITNNVGGSAIALSLPTGTSPAVINNAIMDNAGTGIALSYFGDVTIGNNVVVGNNIGISVDYGNVPLVRSNDVWNNKNGNYGGALTDQTGINGNISVDPAQADPSSGNYHLLRLSPCVDAGASELVPAWLTTDFDGQKRIVDGNADGLGAVDIGPDEYRLAMHVGSIDMSVTTRQAGKNLFGFSTASVLVADDNGSPVGGVVVSGHWSGLTNDTDGEVTDTSGRANATSDTVKARDGAFTFTVDSLAKDAWTYLPEYNLETSDSIGIR